MPDEFLSSKYSSTCVIIDATKLFIEKPSDPVLQSVTWSNYKSHNTLKGLIGISPFGSVTFVSELWAGSISDVELTIKSELLDLLKVGDNVMGNKGFIIGELLAQRGVSLNIPPFMQNGKLSDCDVKLTRSIATLRIHVERAIERVKNFRIIDGCIPNSIPAATVSKIFFVCAMLTNMQSPLLKPGKHSITTATATATTSMRLSDMTNTKSTTSLTHADIKKRLTVTSEMQTIVQEKTKGQNKSLLWFQLRMCRLTSSNFGIVVKRKTKFDVLASQLMKKSISPMFKTCLFH